MAVTKGMTGTGETTDGADEELFFDASKGGHEPCTTLMVRCTHATVGAFIRVEGLHKGVAAGAGVKLLPVSGREYFRRGDQGKGIIKAFVAGDGDATTIDWGPTESNS